MTELFTLPFMQKALLAGILIGFTASYYGVFVVQRQMSFLGSGLAHAAFGGVALGILLNKEPLFIAVPFTLVISLLIVFLREKTRLGADTAIGILFSVSVALGIIFISLKSGFAPDAFAYLFGSILSVTIADLIISSLLTIITAATFFSYWSHWAYSTFDSELAQSDRVPVVKDDYVLFILISITIVVSIKIVGIVLIASFLVIPAAASRLISNTFLKMTIRAVIFGVFSSVAGLWASYFLDLPSGATIILIQAIIFIAALIANKKFLI